MDVRWRDPESSWWAKLRRAQVHINDVNQRVATLQGSGAWSIEREPAGADGWAYRFRLHQPIPADLAAAVADAVANMRASLDHVAYELACHHVGEMSDEQEAATAFPIRIDEPAFNRFFEKVVKGVLRGDLYGEAERNALRCVQPFALTDEARSLGVERSTEPREDLLTDHAYALNTLWNIDKHRRLPGLTWATGMMWLSGDTTACRWVSHVGESVAVQDGTVLGKLHGLPGSGRPQADHHQEMELVLTDDPSPYSSPLVQRLEQLHRSLLGWVIPRIFIVADGSPPPILITSG